MADSLPVVFAGRPADFYAPAEGGIKPVSLKRPDSVSSAIAVRCQCGVKTFLINGVLEAPCNGCGRVVSLLRK